MCQITAQFCFVNYDHSYLNLSLLLFLLPALSHSGVLLRPIVHLFRRLMQHIRHPSVFHHLDWSRLPLCLGFYWSTVHAFMFVRVRDRQRDDRRLSPLLVSHSCVAFSVLSFLLPMLERHSLPSPPKEPHVFGQSGGVMHERMALSPPVVNLSHMMLFFYCYDINCCCCFSLFHVMLISIFAPI